MRVLILFGVFLPAVATLAWSGQVPAQEVEEQAEEQEDDSQRCLNARSIRGTNVIDDNHVVFQIQGRRLFLNTLPKTCTGLSKDRRFSYEISSRRLCELDKIRILRDSGNRLYEGRACSLGRFKPVTVEDLNAFIQQRTVVPQPAPTETADVEEVVSDES